MKTNNKPQFIKQLGKVCAIGIPVVVLIIIATSIMMYSIDKENVRNRIFREFNSLDQTSRIYDGSDYTKRDLFYVRMKEALLDFAERNIDVNAYATVTNHDGIVKASSKESVRMYVLKTDSDFGADYFCEDAGFINWLKNSKDYYEAYSSDQSKSVFEYVTVNDANLQNNGLFIPNAAKISIVSMSKGEKKGIYETKELYSDDYKHAGEIPYGAEYVVEQYGYEDIDVPMEDRYRLILDNSIKGTEAESGIYQFVDEKGCTKHIKKGLGDIEINLRAELLHGSDNLNVFARVNVFSMNRIRYISVTIVELLFGLLLIVCISIFGYLQKKSTFEREMYRINLMNSMAHDLKTPLAAMTGYAENLIDNIRTDKQEHYAKAIKDNVEYMNGLIKNVLLLSKSEAESITLDKKSVDLVNLVEGQWEKYIPMAEDRDIQIRIDGECLVSADENLMSSVIENLLSNALLYAKDNTEIVVTGKDKSFVVENETEETFENGTDNLWIPFEKGNIARSDRNGSGLGLAIVKNVCELHGFTPEIKYEDGIFKVIINC